MNRNDELQWLILGFGLSWPDDDLSRRTNISGLWKEAKRRCFDCERNELWDALYTLSREQAALIKCVSAGEGFHPISFERVRNTSDWTHYFLIGDFGVKVLHERRARYRELSEQLRKATPTHSGWVTRGAHSWRRSAGFRLAENYRFVRDFGFFRAEFCAKQTHSPTPNARYQANAQLGRLYRFRHIDHCSSSGL